MAEGRWEPIGGMWVEADCNLSGPESLARQFLLGRSFFREHFGQDAESPVLWLPDVFGYAWDLPQLIKQAGLDYFFTIKIGWNQYNRLPYDSFWWQGLDGTRVLTHFSTTPDDGQHLCQHLQRRGHARAMLCAPGRTSSRRNCSASLLMAFGYGDGGGGPTREMLENIRRWAPSRPRRRCATAAWAISSASWKRDSGARLPTWNGELYLELHRGTYTTQARNKRANRKSEFLLHDAEFLAALPRSARSRPMLPAGRLAPGLGAGLPEPVPRYHPRQQHRPGVRGIAAAVRRGAASWRRQCATRRSSALARACRRRSAGGQPDSFAATTWPFWPAQPACTSSWSAADGALVQMQASDGGALD